MKEKEAKTKWCPMSRVMESGNDDGISRFSYNRTAIGRTAEFSNCIASACMLWRWEKEDCFVNGIEKHNYPIDEGYCGLAGKP